MDKNILIVKHTSNKVASELVSRGFKLIEGYGKTKTYNDPVKVLKLLRYSYLNISEFNESVLFIVNGGKVKSLISRGFMLVNIDYELDQHLLTLDMKAYIDYEERLYKKETILSSVDVLDLHDLHKKRLSYEDNKVIGKLDSSFKFIRNISDELVLEVTREIDNNLKYSVALLDNPRGNHSIYTDNGWEYLGELKSINRKLLVFRK